MLYNIEVSDEAFEHLKPQRGALWDLKDERGEWLLAYKRDLRMTFQAMLPYLPPLGFKPSVLDIGAGMGGLDLLLWRRYGDGTVLHLLDKVAGEPRCDAHGEPFGDLGVAALFLSRNGVPWDSVRPVDAGAFEDLATLPFNIVVSTQAWCFHFPPEPYLSWLLDRLNRGAIVIVDVRHGKPEWLADLTRAFGEPEAIASRDRKSDLVVFRA